MSLTKIGSIGVSTGIQFAGVTTVSTLHVGSGVTLSSDGDIFATGISTFSEDIKVGSGVTISPDGDGFYTGVVTATTFSGALAASSLTGALPAISAANLTNVPAANITGTLPAISGANLTNLDASDLASGTVPTARLGSGTASSSTFLRGDSTFAAVTSTTINSNANDRIITGSNTANTLNGQSNQNIVSGNLIAGHTASTTVSDGEAPFIQVKSTDSRGGISLLRHSADAASGGVYIGKSRNGTIGSNTIVQDDDELGRITFSGDDGTNINTQAAAIKAHVDGTPGENDMPGRLQFYTTADGAAAPTERLRITSVGDVGVNVTPVTSRGPLHVHRVSSNDVHVHLTNTDTGTTANDGMSVFANDNHGGLWLRENGNMLFATNDTERARIDSSGTLHLGATSYGGGGAAPLFYVSGTSGRQVKIHNTNSATTSLQLTNAATGQGDDSGFQLAALSSGAAYVNNAESAQIYFATNGSIRATMSGSAPQMVVGAQDGFTDYGINNGIFTAYATSGYNASYHVLKVIHANNSFSETGGGAFFIGCRRQSTAAYNLAGWYSGNGSSSVADDRQFRFIADGNAYADASWNGGGADYAEFFEWLDGNSSDEDRKGISVVLDNGKIRAATGSDNTDNIIGVISAAPVVVGDSASERWKEKWITDDFGGSVEETYTITEWYDETEKKKVNYDTDRIPSDVTVGAGSSVLSTDENGNAYTRKKLNPLWDSTATYIPRKDRKEWDIVGLMGKLKVKSDQPIGTRWIKMREVSASVHEYLIR